MKSIFHDDHPQCRYSSGDIVRVIRNVISLNEYIETYVRNNSSVRTPSGDTVFRWIRDIGSESGSHRRNGSQPGQRTSIHNGTDIITVYWILSCSYNMSMEKHLYRVKVKGGGFFNLISDPEVMIW